MAEGGNEEKTEIYTVSSSRDYVCCGNASLRTTEVIPPTIAVKTLAMALMTALIPRPMAEKT